MKVVLVLLAVLTACAGFDLTPQKEVWLKRMHQALLAPRGVSWEAARYAYEMANKTEEEKARIATPQTQIHFNCAKSFGECSGRAFALKAAPLLDFAFLQCDNSSCGCAAKSVLSCNETCSTLPTAEQIDKCRVDTCGLTSGLREAGVQLSEVMFFDTTGAPVLSPSASINGTTPDGEEPSMVVDGDFNTKYFDPKITMLNFEFASPVAISSIKLVTANDHPNRDPVYFTVQRSSDNDKWTTIGIIDDVNGTMIPLTRNTETSALNLDYCVNVYDKQYGEGQCAKFLAGSFTCAADFCPSCKYSHHCDKSCNPNWCPSATALSVKYYRIAYYGLRNPATCAGGDIDPDSWWLEEDNKANGACGVPFQKYNDWYCENNRRGTANCGKSGACIWNTVDTKHNTTTDTYTDSYNTAVCGTIEDCDDSSACQVAALRDFVNIYGAQASWKPLCDAMFSCIKDNIAEWLPGCAKNHVTTDMDGTTCDADKMCANLNGVAKEIPAGNRSCFVDHGEIMSEKNDYLPSVKTYCAKKTCEVFGRGSFVANCDTSDPTKPSCCMTHNETIYQRTYNQTAKKLEHKYMTCDDLEFMYTFDQSCSLIDGPNQFKKDTDCQTWSFDNQWAVRGNALYSCLAQGDIWYSKDDEQCNTMRVCDLSTTFIPKCNTKPVMHQQCSSHYVNVTGNEPIMNLTMDSKGLCQCLDTLDCVAGGYCNTTNMTAAPHGDCASDDAQLCIAQYILQGGCDPNSPEPIVEILEVAGGCGQYLEPACTTGPCLASITPAPMTLIPSLSPLLATETPETTAPHFLPTAGPSLFVPDCGYLTPLMSNNYMTVSYTSGILDGRPAVQFEISFRDRAFDWIGIGFGNVASGMSQRSMYVASWNDAQRTDPSLLNFFFSGTGNGRPQLGKTTQIPKNEIFASTETVIFARPLQAQGDTAELPYTMEFAKDITFIWAAGNGSPQDGTWQHHSVAGTESGKLMPCLQPTSEPSSSLAPTVAPMQTAVPTTIPETMPPHTNAPPTGAPTTVAPDTVAPTVAPKTVAPDTMVPKTVAPSSLAPLPSNETYAPMQTAVPFTHIPVTMPPHTNAPPTGAPDTKAPNTVAPDTVAPNTVAPKTVAPDTMVPRTVTPSSLAPLPDNETHAPMQTAVPFTHIPVTMPPHTNAPPTGAPDTMAPTTVAPDTVAPNTVAPRTVAPSTLAPLSNNETYAPMQTAVPSTHIPETMPPHTTVPTAAPRTVTPSTLAPLSDNETYAPMQTAVPGTHIPVTMSPNTTGEAPVEEPAEDDNSKKGWVLYAVIGGMAACVLVGTVLLFVKMRKAPKATYTGNAINEYVCKLMTHTTFAGTRLLGGRPRGRTTAKGMQPPHPAADTTTGTRRR